MGWLLESLKGYKVIDYLWWSISLAGVFCLTIALTGISAYPEESGRAKGGWAIFGKIEEGNYYFGIFGNYIEVSLYLYIKSAVYTLLTALLLTISMNIFPFTKKGKLTRDDLEESHGADLIDRFLFHGITIIVGGLFFVKSLLCLLNA